MYQDELNKVELPAIEQLKQLGWTYIHGAELTPEANARAYLRDVVLIEQLNAAIKRINPWISDENLKKVSREITHPNFAGLMEYNHAIYQTLINYQSVEQDLGKGRKGQTVKLIDFDNIENNEFICTNQFTVEGANQKIIPDIVCFVNGLPLAVIECKSPYITSPMSEGINQLRRYANLRNTGGYVAGIEGAEKLFWYNQFMVSTCRDQAKVGTISSSSQHYGDWKDAYPFADIDLDGENTTAQQRLLAGMFNKEAFLDLLQNFILYETIDGRLIKKVARYQQFRAVNKVIEKLKGGKTRKELSRKQRSGVVWHTQGSGKSLTMVMLAVKMRRDPILQQYKLVFITDRTQLDEQLSSTFRDAQGETVYNASSVAKLRELLKKDSSDLVTATVQKFQDAEKEATNTNDGKNGGGENGENSFINLNPSEKIIVLADEAHRTQFGGLAMVINAALPNAPKIGFTGTPLLKTQKMDHAFGGYIDQYKINEAVEDGATVRILYEGREVITDVSSASLDKLFEEYFSDYTKEEQREIKKKYGVERAVREAPARIRWVCIDLLKHYREHIQPDGFKAMIVTGSRHAAAMYKKTLDELGAPPSEVIISGDHNDEAYLAQYTDKTKQKKIIKDFTKPLSEDPTAFLIVKDMLLTGFDAPIAQVMYIDRKLQDHTLMQAIARVNRTYSLPNGKGTKSCGFVVDYYGLSQHLTDALDLYTSEDVDGTYQSLKDEIPKLKATHTVAMSFFKNVTTSKGKPSKDVDDYVLALKDEEIRAQFEISFKRFAKQMNVILPDKAASPFIKDLTFLGKVLNAARVRYREEGLDLSGVGEKVRQLVDEHILSTGVDPKIPPVDLLAANFKEKLNEVKSTESKASEVESAIKHHITVNLEEDPEYYKSLSLRLRDVIVKNAGHWERQLELLLEIVDNIEDEHQKAAQGIGLSETEYAFYNILTAEVSNVAENVAERKGDYVASSSGASSSGTNSASISIVSDEVMEEIKTTTQTLVNTFDEATEIVDFFNKQDEVKRMKKEIKRAIIEQSFGEPSLVKIVQERFMDLGKTKFNKQ